MDIQCREKSAITKTYSAFDMDVLNTECSCQQTSLPFQSPNLYEGLYWESKIASYLFGFSP